METEVDTVFLRTIVDGPKSLLMYVSNQNKSNFYIQNGSKYELLGRKKFLKEDVNGGYIVAENKAYLTQLNTYLSDYDGIFSALKTTSYEENSLQKLFSNYYSESAVKPVFEQQSQKIQVKWGVLVGASYTSIEFSGKNFSYLTNPDFDPTTDITGGISFDIVFPRNFQKMSIYNELMYSSYSQSNVSIDGDNEDDYTQTTTNIGATYVKLNNLFRYRFTAGKNSLFVNAGISSGVMVGSKNNRTVYTKMYTSDRTEEKVAIDGVRKLEKGILLGAGYQWNNISVEGRYESSDGISSYLGLKSSVQRCSVLLSYHF